MRWSLSLACVIASISATSEIASATTIVVSGAGNAPAVWDSFHVDWPDPNQTFSIIDAGSESRAPGAPPPPPVPASQDNHGTTGLGVQYVNSNWAVDQLAPRYAVATIQIDDDNIPPGITAHYNLTTDTGTHTDFPSFTPTVTILPEPTTLTGAILLGCIRRRRASA